MLARTVELRRGQILLPPSLLSPCDIFVDTKHVRIWHPHHQASFLYRLTVLTVPYSTFCRERYEQLII